MQVGTYHDGRSVNYDEATDQFDVGGTTVGHVHVRGYDAAGQIAWVSDDMATWARDMLPESPSPAQEPSAASPTGGWFTNLPMWGKVLFILVWPVALAYGLFWMWKDRKYSQGVRIALTAVAAIFVFAVMVSGSSQPSSSTTASSTSTEPSDPVAEAPSEPSPEPAIADPEPTEPEPVSESEDTTPERPEGAESLEMTPEEFRLAWNAAADEFGAAQLTISSIAVDDGEVQDVFQVKLTENAFLQGSVNKDDGSIRDISILAAPKDTLESLSVMSAWGMIIAVTNPDLPNDERGEVLRELGLIDDDSVDLASHSARTSRGDVYYFVESSDLIGIMFGAGDVKEM